MKALKQANTTSTFLIVVHGTGYRSRQSRPSVLQHGAERAEGPALRKLA